MPQSTVIYNLSLSFYLRRSESTRLYLRKKYLILSVQGQSPPKKETNCRKRIIPPIFSLILKKLNQVTETSQWSPHFPPLTYALRFSLSSPIELSVCMFFPRSFLLLINTMGKQTPESN